MYSIPRQPVPGPRRLDLHSGPYVSLRFKTPDKRTFMSPGSQFLDPDGWFPNHVPNPEDKAAMTAGVRASTGASQLLPCLLYHAQPTGS